jgi:hypothetical protein
LFENKNMLKFTLVLIALIGVFGIPVRLRQRYQFSDNTVQELFSSTNPNYSGGIFFTSTTGQVSVVNGPSDPVVILNLGSATAAAPGGSIIGSIDVHPTKDLLYVAYARDPTPAEATQYTIMDNGVARVPKHIAQVSEFQLSWTQASNERVVISNPAYDATTIPIPEIQFGGDGLLYIGVSASLWRGTDNLNDPSGYTRLNDNFFGKVLRINVDTRDKDKSLGYGIPNDNPGRNIAGRRAEVYATGFNGPSDFIWMGDNKVLLSTDDNDDGIQNEVNQIGLGGNFGFSNTVANGQCYRANCTADGSTAPVFLPPLLDSQNRATVSIGLAVRGDRLYVGTATQMWWYSKDFTMNGDLTLLDNEGYSAATRYPNFVYTDLVAHKMNGTVYLVGSGESQKTIVFSVEEDLSAAFVARPAAFLMVLTTLLALLF